MRGGRISTEEEEAADGPLGSESADGPFTSLMPGGPASTAAAAGGSGGGPAGASMATQVSRRLVHERLEALLAKGWDASHLIAMLEAAAGAPSGTAGGGGRHRRLELDDSGRGVGGVGWKNCLE